MLDFLPQGPRELEDLTEEQASQFAAASVARVKSALGAELHESEVVAKEVADLLTKSERTAARHFIKRVDSALRGGVGWGLEAFSVLKPPEPLRLGEKRARAAVALRPGEPPVKRAIIIDGDGVKRLELPRVFEKAVPASLACTSARTRGLSLGLPSTTSRSMSDYV
jgi:hypothetical protein